MKMTDLLKAGGVAGALFAATTLSTGEAHAVAVTGGTTAVTVTADLAGLGLTPGLEGSATAEVNDGLLTVFFPITGGSTGPAGNALIEHEGSGVSLTAEDGTTASVGNFVIKTSASTVFGDLFGVTTGSPLPFFTFGEETALPGVELEFSSTLAGALSGRVRGAGSDGRHLRLRRAVADAGAGAAAGRRAAADRRAGHARPRAAQDLQGLRPGGARSDARAARPGGPAVRSRGAP